jgi:hypothetical protein
MPLQNDLIVLSDLLDSGPATVGELSRRVGMSERGVNYAAVRLLSQRMVAVVGYTDTKPGSHASHRARIFDVGPRVRLWAVRNIKPKQDDE